MNVCVSVILLNCLTLYGHSLSRFPVSCSPDLCSRRRYDFHYVSAALSQIVGIHTFEEATCGIWVFQVGLSFFFFFLCSVSLIKETEDATWLVAFGDAMLLLALCITGTLAS